MNEPLSIVVTHEIPATPEVVFDAWFDSRNAGRWLFATSNGVMEAVEIDPRVGGRFRIAERRGAQLAEHIGTYVELDRPRRLAFDFAADRAEPPVRVTVELAATGRGTRLTLTQPVPPKWAHFIERGRQGWEMIVANLAEVVTGNTAT